MENNVGNNSMQKMSIQWYPGHMTKARRMIEENLKLIDIFIELLDARAVISSQNPDIAKMGANKFRLILLNKADLADDSASEKFRAYYEEKNVSVLCIDARSSKTMSKLKAKILDVCKEKIERDRRRGIKNRPIRAMILGIPNVGKSTFINSFVGRSCTQTGNKPGVTKGKQWIRIDKNIELLDTPGILWPKFDDERIGINLALIGSINDNIIQLDELSLILIDYLKVKYSDALSNKYEISNVENKTNIEILTEIADLKKCMKPGGESDLQKAAKLFLDDFRSGRLGKISLEFPSDNK